MAWNIFWGSENEYFWGYEEIVDIFGGHYIIGLIWWIIYTF